MYTSSELTQKEKEIAELLGSGTGSVENTEKFNEPPAGASLTGTPGQWPWERPPEISDPKIAASAVVEQIQNEEDNQDIVNLMLSGIPLEAIVNTISFAGFVEGKWSFDTGELIKPAVLLSLVSVAFENNIDAKLFTSDPEKEKEKTMMGDDKVLMEMKKRRPDMYDRLMTAVDDMLAETSEDEEMEGEESSQGMLEPEGFMDMEEGVA
jgi:hypothetical protein